MPTPIARTLPFTIAISSAEQAPWTFQSIPGDVKEKCKFWMVLRSRMYLKTGDYTILGMQDRIAIERKSAADLWSTLTGSKSNKTRRQVFERELARLQDMERAYIVVESDWPSMFDDPPTGALPKTIYRSYLAYMNRFPGVHWVFCHGRRIAELTAFRILKRFYEDGIHG